MSGFSLSQLKAIAIVPKFTALLSCMSSAAIVCMITRNTGTGGGKETRNTYHRLMMGMSIADILASGAWFCTTWAIPKGTPNVWGAIGNQHTCSAQAFVAQSSIATIFYNAGLAVYYVLVIVKGTSDEHIAKKFEPLLHAQAIIWGLGTAAACLILELFNPVGWDCWIAAHPLGCNESWNHYGETTCTRGDNASLYQWAFFYAPLWFVIASVTVMMIWIYSVVHSNEVRTQRYQQDGNFQNSRLVVRKAIKYVGAFYLSWAMPTIFQIVLIAHSPVPNFWLLLCTATLVPIQGFFNLLIFFEAKYKHHRKQDSDTCFLILFFRALFLEMGIIKGTAKEQSETQKPYGEEQ